MLERIGVEPHGSGSLRGMRDGEIGAVAFSIGSITILRVLILIECQRACSLTSIGDTGEKNERRYELVSLDGPRYERPNFLTR